MEGCRIEQDSGQFRVTLPLHSRLPPLHSSRTHIFAVNSWYYENYFMIFKAKLYNQNIGTGDRYFNGILGLTILRCYERFCASGIDWTELSRTRNFAPIRIESVCHGRSHWKATFISHLPAPRSSGTLRKLMAMGLWRDYRKRFHDPICTP